MMFFALGATAIGHETSRLIGLGIYLIGLGFIFAVMIKH
jgi:hypothetical protein